MVADVLTDRQHWRVSSPDLAVNEWNKASHLLVSLHYYSASAATTTPCFQKTVQNCFFLSELRQMSTDFDNFWHTDSTNDRFMWGALIFHLT